MAPGSCAFKSPATCNSHVMAAAMRLNACLYLPPSSNDRLLFFSLIGHSLWVKYALREPRLLDKRNKVKENEENSKMRDGVWGKAAPPRTAINQLVGLNQYSPPSLAGWQHSGVIKIVAIDKWGWMEHFCAGVLAPELSAEKHRGVKVRLPGLTSPAATFH